MFHVFTKDIIKISGVSMGYDPIFYYRAFLNRFAAFKHGIINALDTEEGEFPVWLEVSVGLAAKNKYNQYLERYRRDMKILSGLSSYQGINFEALNFISPVETYQRTYVYANDFSEYDMIINNLIEVPEFIDWFNQQQEVALGKEPLKEYLLSQKEAHFKSMMEAFLRAQLIW